MGKRARKEVDERGMMMVNGTVVKHRSGGQASCELSTAEAEFFAVMTGAVECLGMQLMMTDQGLSARIRQWTDSNAAQAIASRRGLGETRHIELKCTWLQDVTKSGRVKMKWVP